MRIELADQAALRDQELMLEDRADALREQEVVIRKTVEQATAQAAKQVAQAQKRCAASDHSSQDWPEIQLPVHRRRRLAAIGNENPRGGLRGPQCG